MADEESAQDHLGNALAASLAGDQTETAIVEFEKALAAGLPGAKEAFARVLLGGEYVRIALRQGLPHEQAIYSPKWARAESEIISGLRLDREGKYSQFSDRNGRSLLQKFDIICSLAGSTRAKVESPQAGIDYIEKMITHCDYLPSSPLLDSLFQLGYLYQQINDTQKAIEYWRRLIAAEPVDYIDQDGGEAKLRRHAQENVALLQGKKSDSTAQRSGKGCVVLIALLSIPSLLALAINILR
jgi:tetratricopeptide (TPR) repeat protein